MKVTMQPVVLEITPYDIETLGAGQKKLLGQIIPIIDGFNFDAVRRTMVALDWKWNLDSGESRVPTISEMILLARHLLTSVVAQNLSHSSSGGFVASQVNSDYNDDIILRLEFVAEHYDYDFVESDFIERPVDLG